MLNNTKLSHFSTLGLICLLSLSNAKAVTFSYNVPTSQKKSIEKDLEAFDNIKFKDTENSEAQRLMGLNPLNASSARAWLDRRVQYIVEGDALSTHNPFKKIVYVEKEGVTYPDQNVIPYALTQKISIPPSRKGLITMSNIGAGLYLQGKFQQNFLGMKISSGFFKSIAVMVESPRVGIIQIGEGLFSDSMTINRENPDSLANSLHRLHIFFHEARHGDGHGSSLSFLHSPCPAKHYLAGHPACDESLNGPYTIGGAMLVEMTKSCDTCTEKEKQVLKAMALDAFSRVLKTTYKGPPSTHWDGAPEKL